MSIILDSPHVAVSLGITGGVLLSPILENPSVADTMPLANAADQTSLPDAEQDKSKNAVPRKPRTRGRGKQRRTSLEAMTGSTNVPRPGASLRLPSTIKQESVAKVEAADGRRDGSDAKWGEKTNVKGNKSDDEEAGNATKPNMKRVNTKTKNSTQPSPNNQSSATEGAEDVSAVKKNTSKRRRYTKRSKSKDKSGKNQAAVERAGAALGCAVAEVVKNARGTPAADGGGKKDGVAGGRPTADGDGGIVDAGGRPSAEGGEAGRGTAMAGGREELAEAKGPVDSNGTAEAVARRVESAVDAKTDVEPAITEVAAVTSEVAAGSAEIGEGAIAADEGRTQVDDKPVEVDVRPVEIDTEARVKSKSKPRPRRNNRKGGKSRKRSGAEETDAGAGTKAAQVDAHDGAPAGAGEASSVIGGSEQLAVGGGEAKAQTREDLTASGEEQADGVSAAEGNKKAAEGGQGKKSGTRRRFWKGRAKRGGKETDKQVVGESADGGPAPAEDGKAACADNGTAASADQKTTDVNERKPAVALDGATDSVKGLSVDASKLSRSGTPSGKAQARRRRRTPARGGRPRGGRARENAAVADAAGESAGAHGESVHTAPVVSGVTTPVASQVAAYSVSGTNDAFVVTRTVDIGADVSVPVVLLAVT